MLPPTASESALRRFFRKHSIAEISDLFRVLDTRSRMSAFRRLKAIGYLSSFNHGGRYYTLTGVPQFDHWGLWFHGNVGFSRAGTLKSTVIELVNGSKMGMTSKDLLTLLKLRVANTLYNTLHDLLGCAQLRREKLDGHHLYLGADPGRADEQLIERRQDVLGEAVPISADTIIAVLVEALQAAGAPVEAAVVATRLAARGVVVSVAQAEQILARHGLAPEKKTLGSP